MANYTKLKFAALDISGRNYLSWILDIEIHLDAMEIRKTITNGNDASRKDRVKAMIFIRRRLHEALKFEYLTVEDPLVLWNNMKERYGHQKAVILPRAHDYMLHMRLQDYKSVSEYNSALFRIISLLKLCGDKITEKDMLEKTYSTFHANNRILLQQYREKGYEKYSDLILCLLTAKQNNELLMRNHESHPNDSMPFPEANRVSFHSQGCGCGHDSLNYEVRRGHIQKPSKKTQFLWKWNKWDRSDVSHGKGTGKDLQTKLSRILKILVTKSYAKTFD